MLPHHLRFLGARALTVALVVAGASTVYAPAASAQTGGQTASAPAGGQTAAPLSPQDSAKAEALYAEWRDALAKAATFADSVGVYLKYGYMNFVGGAGAAPVWAMPNYDIGDLLGANPTPLIVGDKSRIALDQLATFIKGKTFSFEVHPGPTAKQKFAEWKSRCPDCTEADADHGLVLINFDTKESPK